MSVKIREQAFTAEARLPRDIKTLMPFRHWINRLFGAPSDAAREAQSETEDEDAGDPFAPFPEPFVLETSDVFDLHSIAPRDVKRVVEEYLREAHAAGFRSVRIIHGKGTGVQRETVRAILKRTPFVTDWTDAPPTAGGWGATVAHLSEREADL